MLADANEMEDNYRRALFDAMLAFQTIEGCLQKIILAQRDLLKHRGRDPKEPSGGWDDWLRKSGLSNLIEKAASMAPDYEVLQHLRTIVDDRNWVSHEACERFMRTKFGGADKEVIHAQCVQLQKVADIADPKVTQVINCLNEIYNEQTVCGMA